MILLYLVFTIPKILLENLNFSLGTIGIEFAVGLILGLLIKKVLKVVVIAILIALGGTYFGILTVNRSEVMGLVEKYTHKAIALGTALQTIVPFGAGLLIGGVIGFIKG